MRTDKYYKGDTVSTPKGNGKVEEDQGDLEDRVKVKNLSDGTIELFNLDDINPIDLGEETGFYGI